MPESTQHKLDRIRPPRVQITYDVETAGAIIKKQLPFVVGIMADLSGTNAEGKPAKKLPPLRERKFVVIDRDNFNDVLASVAPQLTGLKPNLALTATKVRFVLDKALIETLKGRGISEGALERLKAKDDKQDKRIVIGKDRLENKIKTALGAEELKKLLTTDEDKNLPEKEQVEKGLGKVVELITGEDGWMASRIEKLNALSANLKFSQLDDFNPVNVLKQVPELEELFKVRQQLNDLLAKLDGNESLDNFFQDAATKQDAQIPLLAGTAEDKASKQADAPKQEEAPKQAEAPKQEDKK